MSQIFNKSQHPVEVKRISVRIWSLRDEIESALYQRIQECETAGIPLHIDDIKEFYGLKSGPLNGQPQLKLLDGEAADPNSVDALMESLAPPEAAPPADSSPLAAGVEGGEAPTDSIQVADQILADQKEAAAKAEEAASFLKHPYQRQAPDSDKISYGFALLADVNMDWLLTFSKNPFVRGQSVVIEFLIPRPFMMSAEIVVCNHYAMRSRIISESKPDFRLQCRFTYAMSGERGRLRDFLTSVEPTLPPSRKAQPKKDDEAGPL